MRHLRSILYALVLAPAVWILCGVGFDQDLTGRARDNGGIESLSGVLLLLLAGAAYAILLFSPISPAGPLLAGLAFLGVGAWARVAPESYAGVWPASLATEGFNVSTPGYGLAVLLAVPLVGTALSARRWAGFEPPQLVFIGTIGRARGAAQVAGTPMAAERTTVIPQQRSAPGYAAGSSDTTQVVRAAEPTVTLPVGGDERTAVVPTGWPDQGRADSGRAGDNGDEKAVVMQLGRRAAPAGEEPTQIVPPRDATPADAAPTTEELATDEPATEMITASPATDDTTRDVVGDEPTMDMGTADLAAGAAPAGDTGHAEAEDETTRDVGGDETTRDVATAPAEEVAAGDETTRLVLPASDRPAPAADDGDERTQLLTLPIAGRRTPDPTDHGTPDRGERTQVIRFGTVEPPGDRTQLLTFTAPDGTAPAATQTRATSTPDDTDSRARSIAAAERPDPGDDPTTRLSMVAEPGAAPNRERRPMSATSLERPADEAADDTRPLTLPVPRPPADDA